MPLNTRPVSIPTTNTPPFKRLFSKLAAQPQQSWRRFQRGLAIFVAGAVLILAGARFSEGLWVWLQVPGMIAVAVGGVLAAWGYAGLLAHRLTLSFNQSGSRDDKVHRGKSRG